MINLTAIQEAILLDLIKDKRPETWTDEEYDLIIAASRCNDWQDLHGELLDAINDHEYYLQIEQEERENDFYAKNPKLKIERFGFSMSDRFSGVHIVSNAYWGL